MDSKERLVKMMLDALGQKIDNEEDLIIWGEWPRKTPKFMPPAPGLPTSALKTMSNGNGKVTSTMCAVHTHGSHKSRRRETPAQKQRRKKRVYF